MNHALRWSAVAVTAVLLIACGKRRDEVAAAMRTPTPATQAASTVPDTSVPPAAAVLTAPAAGPKVEAPGTRSSKAMTRAEESSAMPMGGQANDHSAPPTPAAPSKRASAP